VSAPTNGAGITPIPIRSVSRVPPVTPTTSGTAVVSDQQAPEWYDGLAVFAIALAVFGCILAIVCLLALGNIRKNQKQIANDLAYLKAKHLAHVDRTADQMRIQTKRIGDHSKLIEGALTDAATLMVNVHKCRAAIDAIQIEVVAMQSQVPGKVKKSEQEAPVMPVDNTVRSSQTPDQQPSRQSLPNKPNDGVGMNYADINSVSRNDRIPPRNEDTVRRIDDDAKGNRDAPTEGVKAAPSSSVRRSTSKLLDEIMPSDEKPGTSS